MSQHDDAPALTRPAATTAGVSFSGPKLAVRDWADDDFEAFFEIGGDAEVCRYLPWGPFDREGARRFLDGNRAHIAASPRTIYRLAAVDRASGDVVGLGALFVRREDVAEMELGYSLRRRSWGQGWASELLRTLEAFAFETFHAHRVVAVVDPVNVASVRVLERGQFRREGHFIQAHRQNGGWADELVFGRLAHEYFARA
jgi:ribosomal-protein-alanine N-acetyltransferase